MANQQKEVQQDTAYSAVVVNDHMYPYIICSCFYDPFWVKNDIGTGIHMIIHYNCTIGSIFFLLICYPYPSSFHEMIFILVPLIYSLRRT